MNDLTQIISNWASSDCEIYKVHIFGSRVQGSARDDSDIDVAVEFKANYNDLANWIQRSKKMKDSLQMELPCKLDLQWYGGPQETKTVHKGLQAGCLTIYEANI